MELKERLAELRRSRGYSLRELREQIELRTGEKVAISYLSALERVGRTPSVESLTRIAAGYGLSLQELLSSVDSGLPDAENRYSATLEAFARDRRLSDSEKESLSRIEYRGNRPETEQEFEAILSILKLLEKRRQ